MLTMILAALSPVRARSSLLLLRCVTTSRDDKNSAKNISDGEGEVE